MKKLNKIEVFLPSFFKPKFTANLVRLGRNNDGGYLIDKLSIGGIILFDDYFIKRPWRKIIDIEIITLLEAYNKKGLLGEKFINDILINPS